jgi:hypothetical protein
VQIVVTIPPFDEARQEEFYECFSRLNGRSTGAGSEVNREPANLRGFAQGSLYQLRYR